MHIPLDLALLAVSTGLEALGGPGTFRVTVNAVETPATKVSTLSSHQSLCVWFRLNDPTAAACNRDRGVRPPLSSKQVRRLVSLSSISFLPPPTPNHLSTPTLPTLVHHFRGRLTFPFSFVLNVPTSIPLNLCLSLLSLSLSLSLSLCYVFSSLSLSFFFLARIYQRQICK